MIVFSYKKVRKIHHEWFLFFHQFLKSSLCFNRICKTWLSSFFKNALLQIFSSNVTYKYSANRGCSLLSLISAITFFIECDPTTYEIIFLIKLVIVKTVLTYHFIEMGQNNDSNNSTGGFEINVLPMILCIIVGKISDIIKYFRLQAK